jgi:cytochrome c553
MPSFRSRGHGTGDWDAELRGNPGSGATLDGLVRGARMPVGTLLVQRHQQRQVEAELGVFVMEKKAEGYFPAGGDWEYIVVARDGRIEARGQLATCARCHAEAPVDFVFPRIPRAGADSNR